MAASDDIATTRLTDREVREKLAARGPGSLSDAELLSVFLQDGPDGDTVAVAGKILEDSGGFAELSRMGIRHLRMAGGMGVKRAALVSAAFEIGNRMALEGAALPQAISTNDDVIKIFRPQLSGLGHEEFWVIYLSAANTILAKAKVSQGGAAGTAVDHKIVIKRAVELLASSMILVHNHPSGIASPSAEDETLTGKIIAAAALFDIAVLDHLIITQGECFSFRQAGLI